MRKSCVDFWRKSGGSQVMDRTEEARVKIVLAMESLEDALVDGLPAQSPQSDAQEIRKAIVVFRARIETALTHVSEAELLISDR
jgi:hypothetical protein